MGARRQKKLHCSIKIADVSTQHIYHMYEPGTILGVWDLAMHNKTHYSYRQ